MKTKPIYPKVEHQAFDHEELKEIYSWWRHKDIHHYKNNNINMLLNEKDNIHLLNRYVWMKELFSLPQMMQHHTKKDIMVFYDLIENRVYEGTMHTLSVMSDDMGERYEQPKPVLRMGTMEDFKEGKLVNFFEFAKGSDMKRYFEHCVKKAVMEEYDFDNEKISHRVQSLVLKHGLNKKMQGREQSLGDDNGDPINGSKSKKSPKQML